MADPVVLILGGTREAAQLAKHLVAAHGEASVITSLAGSTAQPAALAGRVRRGGFGGSGALADWLGQENINAVIDATHPFAEQISANAAGACAASGVPRIALVRPQWQAGPGDNWTALPDIAAAASAVPGAGLRVFLGLGSRALGAFSRVADAWFLVRMVDPPAEPLPLADYELVLGRGPFDVAAEKALLARHAIDLLITRNSGGEGAAAKLAAARALGLPVLMIARPAPPEGPQVETVDDALTWAAGQLARNTCV